MEASPPPEASLLYRARESAGVTLADAAKAAGITDTRWSQIERGHERRKGIDVPARARAGTLARMARAIGIPPERLESEGQRPDAAEILREILRQPTPGPRPLRPALSVPVTAASEAEEVLARLLAEHSGDEVIQAIGAPAGPQALKPAYEVVGEVLRWLERQGNGAVVEAERARLVGRYPDDEVLQTINRQSGKRSWMVTVEMLDWLSSQGPAVPQARNGTAG